MKHILLSTFGLLLIVLCSFVDPDKHLNKLANRVWGKHSWSAEAIVLPDSLRGDIAALRKISVSGVEEGYVCYTTAYGCRVGGCASPSNANAQSYETFDYVIAFDQSLAIRQIDIVSYGGEYGYEICRAGWLKQFEGKTGSIQLGHDIDGITGATVSATFLVDDVNGLLRVMNSVVVRES